MLAIVNIRRDGWGNQARAERSASKKGAISGWFIILMAVAVPMALLMTVAHMLPSATMSMVITYLWDTITLMTIGSTIGMTIFIRRMLRHYRTLAP